MQFDISRSYIQRVFSQVDSISLYEDDGFIRSDIDRPGMNQLRDDIATGLIDCVVIYKIDRVCSDMLDFCLFYAFLKEHDVKFVTVQDGIDTTTPMGEAMMYLAVVFSNIEIRNATLRVTDNMNHLAASGFWCGGRAPYGYDIVAVNLGTKSHKTLKRNEAEIAAKDELIRIFLENRFSLQAMETHLRNQGIRSQTGAFFSTTQLHQILCSPHCVENTVEIYDYFDAMGCNMDKDSPREKWDGTHGVIVYGRTTEKRVNGKKKHVLAPPEKWRVSIGYHEPYLAAETWLRIQGQFSHNTIDKKMKYDTTLLKGVLRCKCGRLLSLARKPKKDGSVSTWYHCPRREREGSQACDMSAIDARILDEKVLGIFREIEHDPEAVKHYLKEYKKPAAVSSDGIRKQLREVEKKIRKLTAALATNSGSTAAKYIIAEIEKLDTEQNDLNRRLLDLKMQERREAADLKSAMNKREEVLELLANFDKFTAAEKNEIARSVIREAVWDGESLFLTL